MSKLYIGVDGGKNTGVCIYQKPQIIVELFTCTPIEFMQRMQADFPPEDVASVWVEDPQQNRPTFTPGHEKQMVQYTYKQDVQNVLKTMRKIAKISQDVGRVKETSTILCQWLAASGYTVKKIRPTSGKWDAEWMKRITGYEGRTNAHTRDAAKLVWGL